MQLLVVGHEAFPTRSSHGDLDPPPLPKSEEVLASLELPDSWVIETKAPLYLSVTGPDGTTIPLSGTVLRIRREHRESV